jgi:hypothetical protein
MKSVPQRLKADFDLIGFIGSDPEGTPSRALSKRRLRLSFSAASLKPTDFLPVDVRAEASTF